MEELLKLAIDGKWNAVLEKLKDESPLTLDRFIGEYCRATNCDDFGDNFTKEQRHLLRELSSSDRRVEYYKKIPIEEMTDEEYADYKASAW